MVVGVDGSAGSRAALVRALTEAALRSDDLEVVTCYPVTMYYFGGAAVDVPDIPRILTDTEGRIRDLVEDVRREEAVASVPGMDDVVVRLLVTEHHAATELVERSADADLLVVGSRGRGEARSALLGSVALHCATHAACPVLVVHPDRGERPHGRVVVGVDGSAGSREALAEAAAEARRTGGELEVQVTYSMADYWMELDTVVVPSAEQITHDLQSNAARLVEEVLAGLPGGAALRDAVRISVVEGPAGEVLVHSGRLADLLVVGSKGGGAFRGLLLGSVALHCAVHAPCPVMVVPPQRDRGEVDESREPAMAGH